MIAALLVASAVAVPGNFLLYEKAAATKDPNPEHSWTRSSRTSAALVVNPCRKSTLAQAGRTSARTLVYTAVPDYSKSEQVILYASPDAASKAVKDLGAAARSCSTRDYRYTTAPARLGDEALVVTGQSHQGGKPAVGGERAVVTRRGNALLLYTVSGEWGKPAKADFKQQTKDTNRMLAKICQIADC